MTASPNTGAHRFVDEWLTPLVARVPEVSPGRIQQWRSDRREFLSQSLMDDVVLDFSAIAGLIRSAYRIESVQLRPADLDRKVLALVPEAIARRHRVVPVEADARSIRLAMADPLDPSASQAVEAVTGRRVVPLFCPPARLHELALEQLDPDALIFDLVRGFDVRDSVEVIERGADDGDETVRDVRETVRAPVVKLADAIIAQAVRMGASDIHIEHEASSSVVRYRIDGILQNVMTLPRYVASGPLVARIKIMSGLDVSIHFRPQDGRAKARVGGAIIGLRVSTLPSQNGEKVVMRVLNENAIQVSLDVLGFHPESLDRLRALISQDQGVLLVTGPTGSGKTTTLYAMLRDMASEQVNVVTVEDPIEYNLAGITQVQVSEKRGLTFGAVLRSVLRQDPDVILVGEIRDGETANVAMQAAQTGHLVLSTLHTNDAVSAVVRLSDLDVETFKIADAMLGVTAQRLVRRLCDKCARPASPGTLPDALRLAIERLGYESNCREHTGCTDCRFTGYRGRLPLIEMLILNDEVRTAIAAGADSGAIRAAAVGSGALRTLDEDVIAHIAAGRTTADECRGFMRLDRIEGLTPAVVSSVPTAEAETGMVESVVVAMAKDIVADQLRSAGMQVEQFTDGASALAGVARLSPDVLVVGPDLTTLSAAQLLQTLRNVMGFADLPVVAVGEASVGAEHVADLLTADAGDIASRVRAVLARHRAWSDIATVMQPPIPVNDSARVKALRATGLLDTEPEDRFDSITRRAMERLGTSMAIISLVDSDRQWLKSRQGISGVQVPRHDSFCAHGINYKQGLVVPDARLDYRFATNPSVLGDPNIRFYAGRPIRSPGGHAIGMMCVLDDEPREFSDADAAELDALRDEVELELRTSD